MQPTDIDATGRLLHTEQLPNNTSHRLPILAHTHLCLSQRLVQGCLLRLSFKTLLHTQVILLTELVCLHLLQHFLPLLEPLKLLYGMGACACGQVSDGRIVHGWLAGTVCPNVRHC